VLTLQLHQCSRSSCLAHAGGTSGFTSLCGPGGPCSPTTGYVLWQACVDTRQHHLTLERVSK
jgi:hypothetical protein